MGSLTQKKVLIPSEDIIQVQEQNKRIDLKEVFQSNNDLKKLTVKVLKRLCNEIELRYKGRKSQMIPKILQKLRT